MQVASSAVTPSSPAQRNLMTGETSATLAANNDPRLAQYKVIRRNGAVVAFEPSKIAIAVTKAFLAVNGGQSAASARVRELTAKLTDVVVAALMKRKPDGGAIHIEEIQDQVELALMRGGEHEVARAYVLYREKRSQERAHEKKEKGTGTESVAINVIDNGVTRPLDIGRLTELVRTSCEGLSDVEPERVLKATLKDLYDGVPMDEVRKCVVLAARTLIEKDPAYSFVTARLLLDAIRFEALGEEATQADMATKYAEYFPRFVKHGIKIGLLNEGLAHYDLKTLGAALVPSRDMQFGYLGLQTLYDRYFLIDQYAQFAGAGRRFELPQAFFMRVAMGLALNEVNREARAIEFYNVLSTFDFMSSTPTLFNSGTHRSQLSSCYLTTVADDLDGIYEAIKENALLSKFAGGLGNDWTNVRALGSHIKGTNGKSQGVVPFLKVVNDTAVAVNQGGKRKGAVCSYLETWHLDIEEFLELRKNTGDDRRRTHDMNTANWIPDLFMKRVMEGGDWTLFSPADVPDLHDKWGRRFEEAYTRYEEKAARGESEAVQEAACAAAVAQDAVDAVRDRASVDHVQGCLQRALAAVARRRRAQLEPVHRDHAQHQRNRDRRVQPGLGEPARAHEEGRQGRRRGLRARPRKAEGDDQDRDAHAGQRHRHQLLRGGEGAQFQPQAPAGGPGHHGLPGLPASAEDAVRVGRCDGIRRSLDGGGLLLRLLGIDRARRGARPLQLVQGQPRGTAASCRRTRSSCFATSAAAMSSSTTRSRWTGTRCARGSSSTACAIPIASPSPRPPRFPTSSASAASIEPEYQNIYVKSNLSGEFTVVNEHLVAELKRLDLWDEVMVSDLKYFDGSLARIDRIPAGLRQLYATAFEVDATWIVEAGARRQKWIDQAQSLNIYMAGASGKKLDETYKLAWMRGLKTTYYLRTLAATSAEKSTGQGGELNAVPESGGAAGRAAAKATAERRRYTMQEPDPPKFCAIDNPDCESCQ